MLPRTFKIRLSSLCYNKLLFMQKYRIIVFHIKLGMLRHTGRQSCKILFKIHFKTIRCCRIWDLVHSTCKHCYSWTPTRYIPCLGTRISLHYSFLSYFAGQRQVRCPPCFTTTRPPTPAPGFAHRRSCSHPSLLHPSLWRASTAEAQAPSPPRENQVSQPQRERLPPAKSRQPRCQPARPLCRCRTAAASGGLAPLGKLGRDRSLGKPPPGDRAAKAPAHGAKPPGSGGVPTGPSLLPPGSADRTLASSSPPAPTHRPRRQQARG